MDRWGNDDVRGEGWGVGWFWGWVGFGVGWDVRFLVFLGVLFFGETENLLDFVGVNSCKILT